jgi:hypothetical protein
MKKLISSLIVGIAICANAEAQRQHAPRSQASGNFSLGTRNTVSAFSDDPGTGLGIGGQFRLQVSKRMNTEWYADYITSKFGNYSVRNDYHIGWSVLIYPGNNTDFTRFFQPYFIAGHCFDYSLVRTLMGPEQSEDRYSMATQAGVGTHLNITTKLDCSLSTQYMLHFGKEIETEVEQDAVLLTKHNYSTPHGHLLFTISFNYKFADLWS